MDIGLLVTFLAALAAQRRWLLCHDSRGRLGALLLLCWAVVSMAWCVLAKSWLVAVMTTTDLAIAVTCMVLLQREASWRAQLVGIVSMALMPAHFVMSMTQGGFDWTAYALILNAGFVVQCAVAGGWIDGLVIRIAGFRDRSGAGLHRDRGR
ncbi:hypothetical protein [Sphingomonas hengshuiensis]|uniref:Uncharacterized protein n=1 Tax=Sphingomonas hengshuiensis TaxID=1609977 RepID=A0A7U4J8L9_9SPHN|nr:hypothetical protein [Sphingomonas hengshuiensis]AJP72261.1 hypothetical protein TS85_11370 [Sphingomonas hengshuiensis]